MRASCRRSCGCSTSTSWRSATSPSSATTSPTSACCATVGLPVAVGNAVPEVREVCAVRLTRHGGRGAVREFAEALLRARGQWEQVVERYVSERSAVEAPAS